MLLMKKNIKVEAVFIPVDGIILAKMYPCAKGNPAASRFSGKQYRKTYGASLRIVN
jgi:hypothetical protein